MKRLLIDFYFDWFVQNKWKLVGEFWVEEKNQISKDTIPAFKCLHHAIPNETCS